MCERARASVLNESDCMHCAVCIIQGAHKVYDIAYASKVNGICMRVCVSVEETEFTVNGMSCWHDVRLFFALVFAFLLNLP